MRLTPILAAISALLVTGCSPVVSGTPVRAPEQERAIDCDLIFPGPSNR